VNEKVSEGLTHELITSYISVVVKRQSRRYALGGATVSELQPLSGATFRARSLTPLPRAKALGCSVGPFHGQSAVGTIAFTSSLFPIGCRRRDGRISIS
jgi:hypothetical protein